MIIELHKGMPERYSIPVVDLWTGGTRAFHIRKHMDDTFLIRDTGGHSEKIHNIIKLYSLCTCLQILEGWEYEDERKVKLKVSRISFRMENL